MDGAVGELEMRIEGVDRSDVRAAVAAAISSIDPEAAMRVDPATGIVHVTTRRDTLEVAAALDRAGVSAAAMTG